MLELQPRKESRYNYLVSRDMREFELYGSGKAVVSRCDSLSTKSEDEKSVCAVTITLIRARYFDEYCI